MALKFKLYSLIKEKVDNIFKELIKNNDFKYMFLSYNKEGLMSERDVTMAFENIQNTFLFKRVYR